MKLTWLRCPGIGLGIGGSAVGTPIDGSSCRRQVMEQKLTRRVCCARLRSRPL